MRRLLAGWLAALGLAATLTGCGPSTRPAQQAPGDSAAPTAQAAPPGGSPESAAAISFTDDEGREIRLKKPCERMISLYAAHTENLYSLGAGDRVIGVHSASTYPPEAAFLPRFDYNADPETVIAAQPDCVLIRPFITNKSPDFVRALENAGITVVSLYPERLADFDGYIEALALLTGTEEAAREELAAFHRKLEEISALTVGIEDRQRVFFESTEVNLRTVTADSMAGLAIEKAGGVNVAKDAEPTTPGSSIAVFGAERILALADEIDVYVSQRGAMNAGGDLHSISIRPGFDTIKAVREGRVCVLNEKLISSPTFRYYKGVRELARCLYPERMDSLNGWDTDAPATKRDFANLIVRARHEQVYLPTSSKYYTETRKGHTFGLFADVDWRDPDFDAIETAVHLGSVGWERRDDKEYFDPGAPVTREELAKAVFLLGDFPVEEAETPVADLEACENPNIVQSLVDGGVFSLADGRFEPDRPVTCGEVIAALTAF